jgi:hypothetical protein
VMPPGDSTAIRRTTNNGSIACPRRVTLPPLMAMDGRYRPAKRDRSEWSSQQIWTNLTQPKNNGYAIFRVADNLAKTMLTDLQIHPNVLIILLFYIDIIRLTINPSNSAGRQLGQNLHRKVRPWTKDLLTNFRI